MDNERSPAAAVYVVVAAVVVVVAVVGAIALTFVWRQ